MAKTNNELVEVARAALDYIDALPKEVVASLPVMPGFDRDWAENTLTFFSNPCSPQESAFYQYDLKPDFVVYRCNSCGFGEYANVGASHEVLCPECGEHSSRMTIPVTLGGERSSAPDFVIYECDDCGALSVDEHESTCHCMGPKRTWTAIPVNKVSGGKDE